MATVVFYVSGHGFGHAARDIEVANALGARRPDTQILVRTSAPRWLFDLTARHTVTVSPSTVDTGVAQRGSLDIDIARTFEDARAFYTDLDRRVSEEAAWLRSVAANLVVSDMPPVAFEAAARAEIPAAALGNFTWDWIYANYDLAAAGLEWLPARIVRAHAAADRAWRLPMHGGFQGFSTIIDVPLVARRSALSPAQARERLGLPGHQPVVLVSFGGFGLEGLPLDRVANDGYLVITTAVDLRSGDETRGPALVWPRGDGVFLVDEHRLYAEGLRYEDLVRAADVVVSKPGYGIISECAANDTALLYTSRGDFIEYDVLVAAMPDLVASGFISNDDLLSGRWRGPLDRLCRAARPPAPRADGAEVVAEAIEALLD
ncbi:MAG: hypothetical protein KJ061_12380 [Vicinamibacteraceae bacterium]|nr:hypothetical protein [Vicinamibacteraceae bacterium]